MFHYLRKKEKHKKIKFMTIKKKLRMQKKMGKYVFVKNYAKYQNNNNFRQNHKILNINF